MTLFKFKFIRKLIRNHSRPIPEDNAVKWKRRLAVGYMIIAWHAFGYVCYQVFIGKADWAKYHGLKTEQELNSTPAQQWAKTLGIKKAEVYKVSGFNVVHYKIEDEEQQTKNEHKLEDIN